MNDIRASLNNFPLLRKQIYYKYQVRKNLVREPLSRMKKAGDPKSMTK